jgi:DNA polymerase-1
VETKVEPPLKTVSLQEFGVRAIYVHSSFEVDHAVALLLESNTIQAIDIETYGSQETSELELSKPMKKQRGLEPHLSSIRTVQIYDGVSTVYVFDVKALGLEPLLPLLGKTFVAHNAVFELKNLMQKGALLPRIGCTMLQANILFGGLWSLKDLAKEILDIELSKEQQKSDWSIDTLSQEQIEYAALDAVITKKLFDAQYEMLKNRNLLPAYTLMRDAMPAIAKLELAGIHINSEEHQKLLLKWKEELLQQEIALRQVIGDINPNSPQQIGAWLQQHLPEDLLAKWPKTDTDHLKTDIDTLMQFSDLDIVKPQVAYKETSKRISAYGEGFAQRINPVTKRIHASFLLGGTATGRFSCRDPNVQNIPRDNAYRSLFNAPPGRKLVVADFSQLELRVAALIAGDTVMLDAYSTGQDLHKKTAAAVLGIPMDAVTKEQRQMAKAVNFGLLFGQGAKGLVIYAKTSYGVTLTEKEAEKAKSTFFKTYKRLAAWQAQTKAMSSVSQKVNTVGGRVRDFSKEQYGYRATEALNTPIQGSAAEILIASIIRLDKALEGKDAKIVNIIHDEIVIEASESIAEEIKVLMETAMIEGFLYIFPSSKPYIKDLVEAHVGDNWADAKG